MRRAIRILSILGLLALAAWVALLIVAPLVLGPTEGRRMRHER